MLKVNSTVEIDHGLIRQLTQASIRALSQTGEALHTEVVQAQVMPRDTGALQNEKTFVDHSNAKKGRVSIVSEGPYARRLYFHPEYNYQTFENPFAGGKWFEPWLPGGMHHNFVHDAYKKLYKREAGI